MCAFIGYAMGRKQYPDSSSRRTETYVTMHKGNVAPMSRSASVGTGANKQYQYEGEGESDEVSSRGIQLSSVLPVSWTRSGYQHISDNVRVESNNSGARNSYTGVRKKGQNRERNEDSQSKYMGFVSYQQLHVQDEQQQQGAGHGHEYEMTAWKNQKEAELRFYTQR